VIDSLGSTLLGLQLDQSDKELVLSLGEKSQIQAPENSRPTPLPMVGEVDALLTTTSVAPLP
jgi:hypothetical protein